MNNRMRLILTAHAAALAITLLATLTAACTTLEPALPVARPDIASSAPSVTATDTAATAIANTGWQDYYTDPKLAQLITRAIENNRDLRIAVLAVERARALYRIQRADQLPSVGAAANLTRSGGGDHPGSTAYSINLGVTAFEIDLFGRVSSLSKAALAQYLAQEEARRSTHLSLVAELANAYFALAADRESLRIARGTLETQTASLGLTQKRRELGAASDLEVSQARTTVESARAEVARYEGQVARDTNAMTLLVGGSIEPASLPDTLSPTGKEPAVQMQALPSGIPSELLLRRPDILRAEHLLRAANANIGAARAAFFPSIRLTGAVGTASDELSGLFSSGSFAWNVLPSISVPIFQGGRLEAGLDATTADRDIALAQYEKSIQSGFREAADALALAGTLARQQEAQAALVDAATQAHALSKARWNAGRDSYLALLDAQRALYSAQQGLVAARFAERSNRVTLYKVLGGGWKERTP